MDPDQLDSLDVLTREGSIGPWAKMLQGALLENGCIGHVFHNLSWVTPVYEPVKAISESQSEFRQRMSEFMKNDTKACACIISRLDDCLRHELCNDDNETSKDLYQKVVASFRLTSEFEITKTVKDLHSLRMPNKGNTRSYVEAFIRRHQAYKNAVGQFANSHRCSEESMTIPPGIITLLFWMGTDQHEWLRSWRQSNNPHQATLEELMTSLSFEKPPTNNSSKLRFR